MFESLDDRIKHDEQEVSTSKERIMKWVLVVVVTAVLFGGMYMGVRLLE